MVLKKAIAPSRQPTAAQAAPRVPTASEEHMLKSIVAFGMLAALAIVGGTAVVELGWVGAGMTLLLGVPLAGYFGYRGSREAFQQLREEARIQRMQQRPQPPAAQ